MFGSLQRKPEWSTLRNIIGYIIFLISLARNAIVVIIGTAIAYYLREKNPFKITGEVSGGFPSFQLPQFNTVIDETEYGFRDIVEGYGASLIFIPLISVLEAISIAKAFCKLTNSIFYC